MAQWSGSDSGILRKTHIAENHEDLLVFGYACKLFRDDEKALFIDQGKHLIPWMGDDSLKIDRYDCRGALSDLRKYEASREGYDATRWLGLSDKERQLEELCDKERYYSLKMNEEEEQMYKEEEQKRRKMNAIQYSYDVPQNPNEIVGIPTVELAEEEYIPPPILDVPVDIAIPKTVKENARIEKTAMFVCRQGPQMEILIKAKQGDNPHFSFLNQNDRLYKFYRHVLAAFKTGRYQGSGPEPPNQTESTEAVDQSDSDSHYLHPSLLSTSNSQQVESTASQSVPIPQIPFKPSVNCAYSQLVNRIQGNQVDQTAPEVPKTTTQTAAEQFFGQLTFEQQQYYQYYYMQQYYEYYKQVAMYQQEGGGNPGQFPLASDFRNLDPSIQAYIQQLAYAQYLQQNPQQQTDNNSYAQIVSNVNKDENPYTANLPELPANFPHSENSVSGKNSPVALKTEVKEESKENGSEPVDNTLVKKPLLSLVTAYGSESDSDSDDSTATEDSKEEKKKELTEDTKEIYQIPTGEFQLVIDKMADYVSKNGDQFEEIIRAKKDPRFQFLEENHEFNKYYKERLRELKGGTKLEDKKVETKKEEPVEDKRKAKRVKDKDVREVKIVKKEKKVIAPVSFSIKKAKEDPPKEIKSALPIEESDEEETENSHTPTSNAPVVPSSNSLTSILTKFSEAQSIKKEKDSSRLSSRIENNVTIVKDFSSREKKEVKIIESSSKKNGILDGDDPLMEIIELTAENGGDRKDSKRAEDKIKDKLALAAREKLAAITKDRALQLERKRRAAAFLKQKLSETTTPTIDLVSDKSKSPPSRRDSVEIIDDNTPTNERTVDTRIVDTINLDQSSSNEREKSDRKKSRSNDVKSKSRRKKEKRSRHRSRSRSRSRDKEKRRRRSVSTDDEEEDEGEYRTKGDRKDRKKSHKRKHSKHRSKNKKKSKRRHRRGASESSERSDTS